VVPRDRCGKITARHPGPVHRHPSHSSSVRQFRRRIRGRKQVLDETGPRAQIVTALRKAQLEFAGQYHVVVSCTARRKNLKGPGLRHRTGPLALPALLLWRRLVVAAGPIGSQNI